jgi:hypothetical protein
VAWERAQQQRLQEQGGEEGEEEKGRSAAGREAALPRELEVVKRERDAVIWHKEEAVWHKEEALRELRSKEQATRRAEARVCVYYCSTYYKSVRVWGGGNNGGHVLRGTTSRGLCGLVCPSRTSERGGEGYCVKGGGGEDGERERERARNVRLHYSLG